MESTMESQLQQGANLDVIRNTAINLTLGTCKLLHLEHVPPPLFKLGDQLRTVGVVRRLRQLLGCQPDWRRALYSSAGIEER